MYYKRNVFFILCTLSKAYGDVIITLEGDLQIESSQEVILDNGFCVQMGGELSVTPNNQHM